MLPNPSSFDAGKKFDLKQIIGKPFDIITFLTSESHTLNIGMSCDVREEVCYIRTGIIRTYLSVGVCFNANVAGV